MKRVLKVLALLIGVLLLFVAGAALYVSTALPAVELVPDLHVEVTPARVERGAYLANSVCVCVDCHSTRDWDRFSGPVVAGSEGMGGEKFDRSMQFPGEFYAKNITPFGLKNWSDAEIYRAITSGVSKDGHPFFPVMPYPNYNQLATEDVYSIIAYLRSLAPIETPAYAESEIDFPVNLIMRTVPQPAQPTVRPAITDPTYGDYMVNAAACLVCHTRTEQGKVVGEPFAGGFVFNLPNGAVVRSSNITMHPTDGIGAWDREMFIARFKQYADSSYVPHAVDMAAGDFQTVMPWTMYAGMSEDDLGAIYDHIKKQPAVAGKVEKWTSPGE